MFAACLLNHFATVRGNRPQALLVQIPQDRHHQPLVNGDGQADVCLVAIDESISAPGHVHVRHFPEGECAGAHDHVVERDFWFAGFIQFLPKQDGEGHVDVHLQIKMWDGRFTLDHAFGNDASHSRKRYSAQRTRLWNGLGFLDVFFGYLSPCAFEVQHVDPSLESDVDRQRADIELVTLPGIFDYVLFDDAPVRAGAVQATERHF